jgi:hypothetical protein
MDKSVLRNFRNFTRKVTKIGIQVMIRLGRVLSQPEIDGLLQGMLTDSSVLPVDGEAVTAAPQDPIAAAFAANIATNQAARAADSPQPATARPTFVNPVATDEIPAGIAAFKAKIAAARAAQQANSTNE